jgi:hypothetical protein
MMFHVLAVNMISHKFFKVNYGQEKGMGRETSRGRATSQP